jgi:hypothetical protein
MGRARGVKDAPSVPACRRGLAALLAWPPAVLGWVGGPPGVAGLDDVPGPQTGVGAVGPLPRALQGAAAPCAPRRGRGVHPRRLPPRHAPPCRAAGEAVVRVVRVWGRRRQSSASLPFLTPWPSLVPGLFFAAVVDPAGTVHALCTAMAVVPTFAVPLHIMASLTDQEPGFRSGSPTPSLDVE